MHAQNGCFAVVSFALLLAPAFAQETNKPTAVPPVSRSGVGTVRTQSPTNQQSPSRPVHHGTHARNLPTYGYGYPYGYGAGEPPAAEESTPAQEAADTRVGPTIFEHNGQASAGTPAERAPGDSALPQNETPATPTVLVFRDGHQVEVANYALTSTTLIVLGGKTEKIALSDLDLSATSKANADRGVEFRMPKPS